jgi:hypothetical protein
MISLFLAAQLAVTTPADTSPSPSAAPAQGRPKAVEVSDWYSRRLTLHRRLSYAVIPIFGFQALAGQQIIEKGANAPEWAKVGHRAGATAIAGVFTANVVTGVWNLWDSRSVAEGRGLRYMHAVSMLTASAGFTWAGAFLSKEAEGNGDKQKLHRNVALTSAGLTVVSGILMKVLND